jgi:hypothetical protein
MQRLWLTVCLFFVFAHAVADDVDVEIDDAQYVVVADPYIEMHTGPGNGYPITHVVERGEEIGVIKRRTDWYKVRSSRGKEGWVSAGQLEQTLQPSGLPVDIPVPSIEGFRKHRWEAGLLGGDFGGATSLTVYSSYTFSRHLSLEADVTQILGNYSDGWVAGISLAHTFVPEWRASPFFLLGTGIIHVEPNSTQAQSEDRTDQVAIVGAGIKAYISERFLLRVEYKNYMVFSNRNDNEDVDEWKAGFAVFFE